jgi:hypothetical protein
MDENTLKLKLIVSNFTSYGLNNFKSKVFGVQSQNNNKNDHCPNTFGAHCMSYTV